MNKSNGYHKVLWSEEHPDEVGEPVALLVHQAGVGVHVNLQQNSFPLSNFMLLAHPERCHGKGTEAMDTDRIVGGVKAIPELLGVFCQMSACPLFHTSPFLQCSTHTWTRSPSASSATILCPAIEFLWLLLWFQSESFFS